ncbi:MAG: hypothetical protein KDD52_06345 [Bdellovibrionales bacterium]|nr:hypothetical protein [Bdellovibrionales bacterium]
MGRKIEAVARYILGAIFLVFGSNGLLMAITGKGFIPMPAPSPKMAVVMGGFFATGYLLTLVKVIEVLAGLMFLSKRYVALGITLLGPIVVNILCLHIFADRSGLPMAIVVTALWAVLLKLHWSVFKPLLSARS